MHLSTCSGAVTRQCGIHNRSDFAADAHALDTSAQLAMSDTPSNARDLNRTSVPKISAGSIADAFSLDPFGCVLLFFLAGIYAMRCSSRWGIVSRCSRTVLSSAHFVANILRALQGAHEGLERYKTSVTSALQTARQWHRCLVNA